MHLTYTSTNICVVQQHLSVSTRNDAGTHFGLQACTALFTRFLSRQDTSVQVRSKS